MCFFALCDSNFFDMARWRNNYSYVFRWQNGFIYFCYQMRGKRLWGILKCSMVNFLKKTVKIATLFVLFCVLRFKFFWHGSMEKQLQLCVSLTEWMYLHMLSNERSATLRHFKVLWSRFFEENGKKLKPCLCFFALCDSNFFDMARWRNNYSYVYRWQNGSIYICYQMRGQRLWGILKCSMVIFF